MTSEHVVPSGALAVMAWGLACGRAYGDRDALPIAFLKSRSDMKSAGPSIIRGANDYYYAIIDCISQGHLWRAEKEFACCDRCSNVKAMRDFKPGEYHRGRYSVRE